MRKPANKITIERFPVNKRKLQEACERVGTSISALGTSLGYSESYFSNRIMRNTLDKQNIKFLEAELGIAYEDIAATPDDNKEEMTNTEQSNIEQAINSQAVVDLLQQILAELRDIKEQWN